MWDMGPQSIESLKTSKPGLFPVANKPSQQGIVIVAVYSHCNNPHLYHTKRKEGLEKLIKVSHIFCPLLSTCFINCHKNANYINFTALCGFN